MRTASALIAIRGTNETSRNRPQHRNDTSQLVTSNVDIAANTPLDPLIAQGVFKLTAIPNDAVVPNAVTSTDQLQGQVTSAPIYQNEQIPLNRLSSGPGSNNLGITPGNVGVVCITEDNVVHPAAAVVVAG